VKGGDPSEIILIIYELLGPHFLRTPREEGPL
jgi:hypothetical protein